MTAIAYIYALQERNRLSMFTHASKINHEDDWLKRTFPMLEIGKHYVYACNITGDNVDVLKRIMGQPIAERTTSGRDFYGETKDYTDMVWPLYI